MDLPVPAPTEGELVAPAGRLSARHVVVTADGYLPALVPDYAGRVRSRRLHMVATAPLAERVIEPMVYSRWGYEYLQQRPDGRVLVEVSATSTAPTPTPTATRVARASGPGSSSSCATISACTCPRHTSGPVWWAATTTPTWARRRSAPASGSPVATGPRKRARLPLRPRTGRQDRRRGERAAAAFLPIASGCSAR